MKKRILSIVVIVFGLMYIISFLYSGITGYITYVPDTCTYNSSRTEYPNWTIGAAEDCTVNDGEITLLGNLTIEGNLTFEDNVTLLMAQNESKINVTGTGKFNISYSNISANNTTTFFSYKVESGSDFLMIHSYLGRVGGIDIALATDQGLGINTTVTDFYNNTIENCVKGLVLYSDLNNISSNNFNSNTDGIILISSDSNTIEHNVIDGTANYGINISSSSINIISNNTINTSNNAIRVSSSPDNVFQNNIINSTTNIGIDVSGSNNTTIWNNTLISIGTYGVSLSTSDSSNVTDNIAKTNSNGIRISNSDDNVVQNNFVNNSSNVGIVIQGSSTNNTIIDNTVDYSDGGVSVSSSLNNISSNNLNDNSNGIVISSNNNTIGYNNIFNSTSFGIWIASTQNNTIQNNIINSSGAENIYLQNSHFNTISDNTLNSSLKGIKASGGINNSITNNNIYNNTQYAIYLNDTTDYNVTDNTVCYNNLSIFNNTSANIDNNSFCIVQVSPANNSQVTSVTNFTFNVTNPIFTYPVMNTSCDLWLGTYLEATNSSIYNNNLSVINYPVTAPGTYVWYIYCNDSASTNWGNSSMSWFTIPQPSGNGNGGGDNIPPDDPTEETEEEIPVPDPGTEIELPIGGVTIRLDEDIIISLFPLTNFKAIIHNITKINASNYRVLLCNETQLSSYEINITADLSYYCLNYTKFPVEEPSVNFFKFNGTDWVPLPTKDIILNKEKKVMCGNITSTPYLISGFIPTPNSTSALDMIKYANDSIIDAINRGKDVSRAQDLLGQANLAWYNCEYDDAYSLAQQAVDALVAFFIPIYGWVVIIVVIFLGAAWYYYLKKRVEVKM